MNACAQISTPVILKFSCVGVFSPVDRDDLQTGWSSDVTNVLSMLCMV